MYISLFLLVALRFEAWRHQQMQQQQIQQGRPAAAAAEMLQYPAALPLPAHLQVAAIPILGAKERVRVLGDLLRPLEHDAGALDSLKGKEGKAQRQRTGEHQTPTFKSFVTIIFSMSQAKREEHIRGYKGP